MEEEELKVQNIALAFTPVVISSHEPSSRPLPSPPKNEIGLPSPRTNAYGATVSQKREMKVVLEAAPQINLACKVSEENLPRTNTDGDTVKVVLEEAQLDNLAREVPEETLPDELESDIKALRQLLEKDKYIAQLTLELDTSRSNAKQLRAELETVQNAHLELVKQLDFWTESFESVRELQALKDEETA
jgi:hypothetical protein